MQPSEWWQGFRNLFALPMFVFLLNWIRVVLLISYVIISWQYICFIVCVVWRCYPNHLLRFYWLYSFVTRVAIVFIDSLLSTGNRIWTLTFYIPRIYSSNTNNLLWTWLRWKPALENASIRFFPSLGALYPTLTLKAKNTGASEIFGSQLVLWFELLVGTPCWTKFVFSYVDCQKEDIVYL